MRPLSAFAVLLAASVAMPAHAAANGTITGRVELRQGVPPVPARPSVSELGPPPARDPADRRRSVVYLETAPRAAFEGREDRRATMDQRNERFVPRVLAVTVGTVVDFPNSDRTYHNVFSLSRVRPFDLGRYAAGRSKSVRFDRPGIVRVFCDIHSHMSAFILVFAHRFFSVTDEEGRFSIADVPPGEYAVTAWHETLPSQSRQVRVPADGGGVEIDFVLSDP